MNLESEAWEGELKILRICFDCEVDVMVKDLGAEKVQKLSLGHPDLKQLFQDYLKRKEIRENYERLNCGK